MFLKGLIFPTAVLVFFLVAPPWLDYRLHEQVDRAMVNSGRRAAQRAAWSKVDFAEVCSSTQPEHAALRRQLAEGGICRDFLLLGWGRRLSVLLLAVWLGSAGATLWLNQQARRSRNDLIRSYRRAWRICITAAVVQLVLLIPLLGYGLFELTTLAFDHFFPQAILAVVIGGLIALWRSGQILLKSPPLEFVEPLARVVSDTDAPGLWRAVREAAQRLGAIPPDQIVLGMQMNFYVTELSVRVDGGAAHGRTLFLSYPMLKLLSPDEVLAIIGHELGHFLGEDTRLTREFYPLRFKVNGTALALAHAGWAGWTSIHGIGFFNWAFGGTEQAMSRERELIADRTAASLTSPATMARALLKFQVMSEAFNLQLVASGSGVNPLATSLVPVIREQLVPNQRFWRDLFEMKTPHPLDSHPDLRTRLASLGEAMDDRKAIAIATDEVGSAYDAWLAGHEAALAEFVAKVHTVIGEVQRQQQIRAADYETEAGRRALNDAFPERRFPMRKTTGRLFVVGSMVITVTFTWLFTHLGGDAGRIAPLVFFIAGAYCTSRLWRWARDTELVLRADRITFTGWNRALPWADVAQLNATSVNGVVRVIFHLKHKAPPFARWTLWQAPTQTVQLSVNYYDLKPEKLLQLIHLYHARQIAMPAASA